MIGGDDALFTVSSRGLLTAKYHILREVRTADGQAPIGGVHINNVHLQKTVPQSLSNSRNEGGRIRGKPDYVVFNQKITLTYEQFTPFFSV